MNYAEVAVNSPGSRSTFCYAVPPRLSISVGQAVWVPFGSRVIQGIVLGLSAEPSIQETKEIVGIIADVPLLSRIQLELAQWISKHYFAPLFDALALMLPPGFERRAITCFQLTDSRIEDFPSLSSDQKQVLDIIRAKGKTSLVELEKAIGKEEAKQVIDQFVGRQLITQTLELDKAKVKLKPFLILS